MSKVMLFLLLVAGSLGCTSKNAFPRAIVTNDELGILRVLTAQQLQVIEGMIASGVPDSKKNNVDVWPDDTVWYRVYVSDGEECYGLRYEFHPSFRKVKVYPKDYTKFPGVVDEVTRVRVLDPIEPVFQPFDESYDPELMDMFAPSESWSGFSGPREIEPNSPPDRPQPVPPDPNRTSPAAGSRR